MKISTQSAFEKKLRALCDEHALRPEGVKSTSKTFNEMHARFFDGSVEVDLAATWRSAASGLHTLSLHKNGSGTSIVAYDSDEGRHYHFPEAWFGAEVEPAIAEIEVNAWSRFSMTPDGRPTGYKQQRFARDYELYFQGDRILRINNEPTDGEHTGKMLYKALKEHPNGVRLTIESR